MVNGSSKIAYSLPNFRFEATLFHIDGNRVQVRLQAPKQRLQINRRETHLWS